MNIYTIIADGKELDTYDDFDISLNYQIDDILDPGKSKTSFSKTIELPGSTFNNKFFKQIFDVNIDNTYFNPIKSIPALIRTSDSEIMTGSLQLLNINNDNGEIYYEVAIYGVLKDIFTRFQDFTLNNLDLSEFNHIRNTNNIISSWDYNIKKHNNDYSVGGPGYGYVYPYIINGNSNNIWNRVEIYDLFPAPYIKTIIDKLFEFTGKTYTSEFIESDYFKKLILPYVGTNLQIDAEEFNERIVRAGLSTEYHEITPEFAPGSNWWSNSNNNYSLGLSRESGIVTDDGTDLEFTDDKGQWNQAGVFTCSEMGQYNINFAGQLILKIRNTNNNKIEFKDGNFEYSYRMKVRRPGMPDQIIEDLITQANPSGTQLFGMSSGKHDSPWYDIGNAQPFNLSAENLFLNTGDQVFIEFMFRYPSAAKFKGINDNHRATMCLKQSLDNSFTKIVIEPATNESMGNEMVNMNQITPNIKMKDFFLSILKMFNLILYDNPNKTNDLIIEPRDKFFESKKKTKDWTSKLDRSRKIKITPMSELDANVYLYTYKADDDFYNKQYSDENNGAIYGEFKLDVNNDFSDKTNKTEILFSPTPDADKFIYDAVAPFFIEKDDKGIKSKKVKPRILFYGGPLYTASLWVTENANQPINEGTFTNKYPYCGMWDHPTEPLYDLGFGKTTTTYWDTQVAPVNTLFEQFHKSTLRTITDINSRLLEGYFHLTPSDIASFDFRDIIFIDGSYWRVNKIVDYNPVASENLTKVILYKIVDYQANNPFTIDLPISSGGCPEDIVGVVGTNTKHGHYYKSVSGKVITEDCCKSIGGDLVDGVCRVITKPVNPWPNPRPIFGSVEVKDKIVPIPRPTGPITLNDNLNSINRLGNIVLGKNIYVSPNKEIINTIIIGDNTTPKQSNSVSIENTTYDKEGIDRDGNSIKIDEIGNIKVKGKQLDLSKIDEIKLGNINIEDGKTYFNASYAEVGYFLEDYTIEINGSTEFEVDINNKVKYKIDADYTEVNGLIINSDIAPTDTTDVSGVLGEIRIDDDYIYFKTNIGWKRSGLSTF